MKSLLHLISSYHGNLGTCPVIIYPFFPFYPLMVNISVISNFKPVSKPLDTEDCVSVQNNPIQRKAAV